MVKVDHETENKENKSEKSNTAEIIDGTHYAKVLREETAIRVKNLIENHDVTPHLAAIIVGDNETSKLYVNLKAKRAREIGMLSSIYALRNNTTEKELLEVIEFLNNDEGCHGILLQLPLPAHLDSKKIFEYVSPDKDVDGFTPYNIGLLNIGIPNFIPCTPQGVMILLRNTLGSENIAGKKAVVIGRSIIVGKPLSTLLLQADCTVTMLHSKSVDPQLEARSADILVSAVGVKGLVTDEWVKEGACVIDVGITKLSGEIYGDVDFVSVANKAQYITPVPGGVGPMTIACLLKNTVDATYKSLGLAF